MATNIVQGVPSTHGDHYQLNTTNLIRHAARTYPEQEIVYRTTAGDWERYTYADCYLRVKRAANALKGLGIGPADTVGLMDWNSKRHFEMSWAIPGLAAVMLQMNIRLAIEDLAYVTDHADASWILVDETLLPIAEALAPHVPQVKGWIVMSDKPLAEISTTLENVVHLEDLMTEADAQIDWPVIDEKSTYSACYTSGTTGRPKGVYYSHRGSYLHAMAMAAANGMRRDDTAMLITPMFHGQSWSLPHTTMWAAAKIILPGRYMAENTELLVDMMIAENVTVANGAPAIFQPMLDYIKTLDVKPDFSKVRLLSGATEPALSLMRDFYELTGADFVQGYGATETTPLITMNMGIKPSLQGKITDDEKWNLKRYQGLPTSGIDIRIVDADDNDLPHDGKSVGEVLMRGPWVIERYHKLDDDADRFLDGYWRSGDVGMIYPNGYFKLTDRIKDVVKSGGEWISSIDMENAIIAHPLIKDAAVVGISHPKWQERPLALVVPVEGAELTRDDVVGVLDGQFAKWQMPDTVLFVDELPRTSVGKLDKKVLRVEHADTYKDAAL
ncbi:long-chain-fatty-acid--CoA ligase [Rhodococcus sp. IEGM 1379]|uniref:long-chain-fatty-acid--CoA ligase n=1 Tax=Rhodococcus sp. IEGM 1379 TaxID=3047086 RepID=UPI0024B85E77|nr:long-chain-fatty-acid--CoA ligase [Rhodococcus sp. IEGM 1379]MDI9916562.1 long-chain-fatty-acid--CoA ligase [Rhodococcus sp. IEGM 1379]